MVSKMKYFPENVHEILSPELQAAVICSPPEFAATDREAVAALIHKNFDWTLFLHWTMRHRIYPQVYRALQELRYPGVPVSVLAALRQAVGTNNARTLQMTGELANLLRVLASGGIPAVVLKGYPLAHQLYGDVTLRPSNDLDIMVWPETLDRAAKLVAEQGYALITVDDAMKADVNAWMKVHHNFNYWQREKQIPLELHWRLCSHEIDFPRRLVEDSLVSRQFAGQSITVLGDEVLLLYLVSHGAGHAWNCLQWLRDLDSIVRQGKFSWPGLYDLADRLAARHLVDQAFILAHGLLKTPLPADIVPRLRENGRANDLAFQALRLMASIGYRQNNLHVFSKLFIQDRKYRLGLLTGRARQLTYILSQVDYCARLALRGLRRRLGPERQPGVPKF